MAPIHKSVTLTHYFQSCTKEKKILSKKCSSQTKSVANSNHSYFTIYYKLNCFKRRQML